MTTTFRVETATTDGMHEIVAISRMTGDVAADAGELDGTEVALVRSAVRGRLDQIGHETGPAVTVLVMTDVELVIESCRPAGA